MSNMEREVLTIPECAKVLGVGRSVAYEMARSGQLPAIRLGRKRLVVPRRALERFLEKSGPPVEGITEG